MIENGTDSPYWATALENYQNYREIDKDYNEPSFDTYDEDDREPFGGQNKGGETK